MGVSDALLKQRRQSVRIVAIFLLASSVAAFVPSRERALILTGSALADPMETVLFSQPFPDIAARTGVNFGDTSFDRASFGRIPFGNVPVGSAPLDDQPGGSRRVLPRPGDVEDGNALLPAAGPSVMPLGQGGQTTTGGTTPTLAQTSTGGTSSGSPGGGTIGTGSSSGGSSSGGSSGGVPALVPEPDVWAMLILGFGLIGGLLRRSRRTTADTSSTVKTASAR